jgi:hypothetical protein
MVEDPWISTRLEGAMKSDKSREFASLGLSFLVVVLAMAVAPATCLAQQAKIGNWRLNISKSTYPGKPPQNVTRQYEDLGCGFVLSTHQGMEADGKPYFVQYVAKTDGKDYPLSIRGSGTINSITFSRMNERAVAYVLKVDGKVTAHGTTTVSSDGNTLTIATTPVNTSEGAEVEVFEREK